tara:strand:- start:28 stop:375 length:348 start_codon:yes stop_codon:yes gene_type:complete
MIELLVIAIVIALAIALPWIRQLDPGLILIVITGLLNLINLGMTIINIIQARRRDPRFLTSGILGATQVFIGSSLLCVFYFILGQRPETWLCGPPFIVGGILVLAIYHLTPRPPR